MTKAELIEAFEAGDIGEVEFFELALETNLTFKEINALLNLDREEFL